MVTFARLIAAGLAAAAVLGAAGPASAMPAIETARSNQVPACVTPARLMRFLSQRNARIAAEFRGIAETYAIAGRAYGVRWDFAFFQMLVETNNLSFRRYGGEPSDVRPEQNNFAGLGAVGDGSAGESFADITGGVQAHLEHILIYAGRRIDNPVAERTAKVQAWKVLEPWLAGFDRPITFRDLALRWSPFNRRYADTIEAVARLFYARHCPDADTNWDTPRPPRPPQTPGAGQKLASAWTHRAAPASGAITPPEPRLARPPGASAGDSIGRTQAAGAAIPQPPTRAARPPEAHAAQRRLTARQPAAASPTRQQVARLDDGTRSDATRRRAAAGDARRAKPANPAPAPARAEEPAKPSPDDQVREMVKGRVIHLKTDMGAVIPIKYLPDGKMIGNAGGLAFFLGASRDTGKWWIKDQRLCQKWRVWLSRDTMCMTLKQRGKIVHWTANDGRSGTATIVR